MAWSPPALERRKWFVEQTRDYATNLFPPHPRRHRLGHPGWTFADTGPLLERVIEFFGPDRVMVGTNLPVDRLFAPGRTILGAIAALAAGLSQAEKRAVLSGTAERVYRI